MTAAGGAAAEKGGKRGEWRIACWLAAVAALAYLPFDHCHFSGTDEMGVFEPAEALYLRGDLAVEEGKHRFPGRDGRIYSHFAIGQSILVVPFLAVGDALGRWLPDPLVRAVVGREQEGRILDTLETPAIAAATFYAPLVSGLLVALFYLFERGLGATRRSALIAAGLLGATTYVACHAVFFLRHTTEALAVLGSFAALHTWRRGGRLRWLAIGSLCASLLVLIRVPAVVAGPALAGYLLWTLRERARREDAPPWPRMLAAAALPALAIAAIHMGVNFLKWGTWIASPMLAQSPLLRGSLLQGLHGLLLSPGASVFVYSPLLLLLPLTLPDFARRQRAECVTAVAIVASFLALCGPFLFWHGLWSSPGPRYLFVATPLLMLPLGPWLDGARRAWQWLLLAGLALAGLVVQIGLLAAHWRRTVVLMGYQDEIATVPFLFDAARSPIVGCLRSLAAGEIDVYLWALWHGVPGRAPQPGATVFLLSLWALAMGLAIRGLCRALGRGRLVAP